MVDPTLAWLRLNQKDTGYVGITFIVIWPTRSLSLHRRYKHFEIRVLFVLHLRGLAADSKVHVANMGPIWGRQDPGGSVVGPMNLAIWGSIRQRRPLTLHLSLSWGSTPDRTHSLASFFISKIITYNMSWWSPIVKVSPHRTVVQMTSIIIRMTNKW